MKNNIVLITGATQGIGVAVEFAPYQITVNSVAPGPTETELFRKSHPLGSDAEKDVLTTIPLGRIGRPQKIAATIKFLLSEDAGYFTRHNYEYLVK